MTTLSILRGAHQIDYERSDTAASKFLARHAPIINTLMEHGESQGLTNDPEYRPSQEIIRLATLPTHNDDQAMTAQRRRIARLWRKCFRRAIKEPKAIDISHGYVWEIDPIFNR